MKAFVIFRDRVTYAKRCVSALRFAGLDTIIVDHGSSWIHAKIWLNECITDGTKVLKRGTGQHPRSMWSWEPFRKACGDGRYIVTDPDVVPSGDCPGDWPQRLSALLDKHPEAAKAGLGLRIDDLPKHYPRRAHVIDWEAQFWQQPIADGAYRAQIDTTLAMYRPLAEHGFEIDNALRTGPPYVAQHLAWYENPEKLPTELRYYYEHTDPGISYWTAVGPSAWGN